MKEILALPLIVSLGTLLFIPDVYAVSPLTINTLAQTQSLTPEQLRQLAQNITVRVYVGENGASGILIAKNGQTYTIITNAHVVKQGQSYRIQTPDGTTHQATLQTSEDAITGIEIVITLDHSL